MAKNEIHNKVTPIHIVKNFETIFSQVKEEGFKYEIPLYQRAFAWKEKEIKQLIEDIFDFDGNNYFIGSLVVAKKDTIYEVIDGQQRLTALYIILNCINWLNKQKNSKNKIQFNLPKTLTFSCRDKSNYTLENIENVVNLNSQSTDEKRVSEEIASGINTAKDILTSATLIKDFDYEVFLKKIEKVVLFRIEVPKNTDLNHYFEIMNTRGEQLEQTDILKSLLMDYLPDTSKVNNDREIFATIWDAISDMNGYVQMHFDYYKEESKDGKTYISNREKIFDSSWDKIPSLEWDDYLSLDLKKLNATDSFTIDQIIGNDNFKVVEEIEVEEERVRFESIIDFSHFLMHTLRVFIHNYQIQLPNDKKIGRQLDDKNLLDEFKNVFKYGNIQTYSGNKKQEYMSKKFILLLLQLRYFYDKYIIKREYVLNSKNETQNEDGEWSLQTLIYYISKGYKNVNFRPSFDSQDLLMIQAAMRVSYTSPKVMHWLTSTLIYLSGENFDKDMLCDYCEDYVKASVKANFLDSYTREDPPGLDTPHIVFNYLDYLLWKEDTSVEFDFEFRTSVEHFYPQHPSEESFSHWYEVNDMNNEGENKESFNIFGNLCLLQRNINAKFSNLSPTSKIGSYETAIDKGSLKLRLMRDSINTYKSENKAGDSKANKEWAKYEGLSYVHESAMLEKLRAACKSKSFDNYEEE